MACQLTECGCSSSWDSSKYAAEQDEISYSVVVGAGLVTRCSAAGASARGCLGSELDIARYAAIAGFARAESRTCPFNGHGSMSQLFFNSVRQLARRTVRGSELNTLEREAAVSFTWITALLMGKTEKWTAQNRACLAVGRMGTVELPCVSTSNAAVRTCGTTWRGPQRLAHCTARRHDPILSAQKQSRLWRLRAVRKSEFDSWTGAPPRTTFI
jgi:hypothetical protein